MGILERKRKIICLISSMITFAYGAFIFENQANAEVKVYDYNLKGVSNLYNDDESPQAYRIEGSPYFPDNTIMYKQSYRGITYYSPKPPYQSLESVNESKEYINWGFWDFKANQNVFNGSVNGKDVLFESSIYYSQARIKSNATVQGTKIDDYQDIKYDLGIIKAGTIVDVLSVTNYGVTRVYFDLNGLKDVNGNSFIKAGYLPVGRVLASSVEPIGNTIKIYFPQSSDRSHSSRHIYDNFKPYSKKSNALNDSSHRDLEPSPTKVPELSNDPHRLSGKYGEWRYLGLNAKGQPVVNPYFPSDSLHFRGNSPIKYYDWRYTPWNPNDDEPKERGAYSGTTRINLLNSDAKVWISEYGEPGIYNSVAYKEDKQYLIKKLMVNNELVEPGDDLNRLTDRFALITNPRRDTPIYVGQRKSSTSSRRIVFLTSTRDLYLYSMTIKDVGGNIIAEARGDIDGNFTILNNSTPLKRGGNYVCHIKIANGSNSEMIKNTLQAQFGFAYDKSVFDKARPYYNLPYRHTIEIGNKGGLTSSIHSKSSDYTFNFSIPSNYNKDFIDLYGYVGSAHTGVDNLNYDNDMGVIRVPVSTEAFISAGDIEVYTIELIDSQGNVVYRKHANGTESIKTGPKSGQLYSIKYTAKYTGEDRLYYEWVPPRMDTSTNEYKPGYYKEPVLLKYEVPLEYKYVRKVKDTISEDSELKQVKFVDASGSTSIPMKKNTLMTYTISNVMFEHPYLSTYFKITSSNDEINSNKSNDYLHTLINDNYDIAIRNVRILPQTEYIGDETKNITYNVTYEAILTTPNYVTAEDYRTQINTSINVNGKVVHVIDQLQVGLNTGLSHQIPSVPVSSNLTSVESSIVLNFDRASYESGNYDNNIGTESSKLSKIKDPMQGNSKDTASAVNNSNNNTSLNRGGDANNNCLVPRTLNKWENTYKIKNWSATPVTYKINSTNTNHTFYRYNVVSNETKTTSSQENFEIKKVLFKSKDTTSKNLGAKKDGWVELNKATESELGLIKSGYGFELKIITEYKTNALLNNPSWSVNKTNGGKTVLNLNSGINLNPEIFVELPGDSNNRKILSVSGYKSTIKGLEVKQTKSGAIEGSGNNAMQVYEWEYTIKPSRTVGVIEVGKIFIPQNLKDGKYKISIYTPPITGVASLSEYNTSKYSALCDRKDVYVKVIGSATDDLNSHITQ